MDNAKIYRGQQLAKHGSEPVVQKLATRDCTQGADWFSMMSWEEEENEGPS